MSAMKEPISPSREQDIFHSSISFNSLSALCALILIIGTIMSNADQTGFAGLMLFAVLLILPMLVIAFVYNLRLVMIASHRRRKAYAVAATIVTGVIAIGLFGFFIYNTSN